MKNIKGAEFLIKEVTSDEIFIKEEFSEEQNMMRDAVQEFIDREVFPNRERFENNF